MSLSDKKEIPWVQNYTGFTQKISFSCNKDNSKGTHSGAFTVGWKKTAGFEGDCAERSEVKTSQCDVFKESAIQPMLLTRRIKRAGMIKSNRTYAGKKCGAFCFG